MKRKPKTKPQIDTTLPPAAQIAAEIGADKLQYIINHRGKQKRSVTARRTGIPRYRLNEIYITLFGQEAI
jgi:hypothetical protein